MKALSFWRRHQFAIRSTCLTIDQDMLEAARLDGADYWSTFRNVKFPLLAPAVTFNFTTALLGSMNGFDLVQATTEGGPGGTTELLNIFIFRTFGQGLFAQARLSGGPPPVPAHRNMRCSHRRVTAMWRPCRWGAAKPQRPMDRHHLRRSIGLWRGYCGLHSATYGAGVSHPARALPHPASVSQPVPTLRVVFAVLNERTEYRYPLVASTPFA